MQRLEESHIIEAAKMYADAHIDNSTYKYIFPDPQTRLENIEWIFIRNAYIKLKYAMGVVKIENSQLIGYAIWESPSSMTGVKPGLWDLISVGLLKMPFLFGWTSFSCVLECMDLIDKIQQKYLNPKDIPDTWYLGNLVVKKELRGKGIGSEILIEHFKNYVDPKDQLVCLHTQEERNVKFYKKHDFEVLFDGNLGSRGNGYQSYFMVRKRKSEREKEMADKIRNAQSSIPKN